MNNINFILTKEHKKFEEFCNFCKDYQYIGLCYGIPGIGKTVSASKYSSWPAIRKFYDDNIYNFAHSLKTLSWPQDLVECGAVLYTADATNTPSRVEKALLYDAYTLRFMKYFFKNNNSAENFDYIGTNKFSEVKLLLIDEADNLKYTSLEQIRALYDRYGFGLVLIGMPGIERRLSRYPQLYSRVGFLHEFKSLMRDELTFIIEHNLDQLQTTIKLDHFDGYETLQAIVRITKGNFRILSRLFQQLERLMKINNVTAINIDLVNAARELLVIGNS